MSGLRPKHFRCFTLALGSAFACALVSGTVAAGQRGRPIEFSTPGGEAAVTNTPPLSAEQLQDESLRRQLHKDLFGALDILDVRNSLGGVTADPIRPPAAPPAQNKRVKELLERRKNWAFLTPDDFKSDRTLEEVLNLRSNNRDGPETKDGSPIERYYEDLDRRKFGDTNNLADRLARYQEARQNDDFSFSDDPVRRDSPLLDTETKLKDLFNSDSTSVFAPAINNESVLPALWGSTPALPLEQTAAQIERLNELRRLWDGKSPMEPTADMPSPLAPKPGLARPGSAVGVQPRLPEDSLYGGVNAGVGSLSGVPPPLPAVSPAPPPPSARVTPALPDFPRRKF